MPGHRKRVIYGHGYLHEQKFIGILARLTTMITMNTIHKILTNEPPKKVLLFKLSITLVVMFLAACVPETIIPPKMASMPSWSSDAKRVVYVCAEKGPFHAGEAGFTEYTEDAYEICVTSTDNLHRMKLTENKTKDIFPAWSNDDQHIASIGADGLYITNLEGMKQRIVNSRWIQSFSWSPDGQRLAYSECRPEQSAQMYVVNKDGDHLQQLTRDDMHSSENPVWSPDGTRLVYQSSLGRCRGTWLLKETAQLNVLKVEDGSISEVSNDALTDIRGLTWLTSNEVTFSSMVKVPGSDATGFQLFIAYVETRQIKSVLPEIYGKGYVWSTDRSWIAYSDTGDAVYITQPSLILPKKIWQVQGVINSILWSPDNSSILIASTDPISGTQGPPFVGTIWIVARDGSTATRLTGP